MQSRKYLLIGAGIHGLSTAYHLALKLKQTNQGSGKDILVIDKKTIGAGASGIACGVVRNNYSQSAMRKLMQHSVGVWDKDPQAYSYHQVGYMQVNTEFMVENTSRMIAKEQQDIGYDSVSIIHSLVGFQKDCDAYIVQAMCSIAQNYLSPINTFCVLVS